MKVLVAFEESQEVCKAFRERGHEAYSNDIQECSGGHPEWHLRMDFHDALSQMVSNGGIDLLIAFPPCQKLSKASGAHWKKPEFKEAQDEALKLIHFIMDLGGSFGWESDDILIPRIAIENPVGKINSSIRQPDQKIQPWQFGHPYIKETCLWLRRLPVLKPTNIVEATSNWVKPGNKRPWRRFWDKPEGGNNNAKDRSKTFPGIAKAMAEQWG
jgi:hypothetical protein